MATAMARAAARRRLRSRTSWPTTDGPTPRPNGVESEAPISEILLGFGDFGCEALDERGVGRRLGMGRRERVRDLVGFDEQILAVGRRRAVDRRPELALSARRITGCEPRHRQTAGLLRVVVGIAACAFFVGGNGVDIAASQEQRMSQVVMAED